MNCEKYRFELSGHIHTEKKESSEEIKKEIEAWGHDAGEFVERVGDGQKEPDGIVSR